MNTTTNSEIRELTAAAYYRPAVSVFMPFEPKMNARADLMRHLKLAADKVDKELGLGTDLQS